MKKKQILQAVAIVICYGVLTFFWSTIQWFSDPVIILHVPLDDMIPFCEWFVIPYVSWYACLAGLAGYFLWKEPKAFFKMSTAIVLGSLLADILFLIIPNGIDFRPDGNFPRDNFLTDVVAWLYSADQPENACPSMHVFHSLAMWAAIHHSTTLKRYRWVEPVGIVMVILITLSTFFIKQHSVLDAVGALLLFLPVYWFIFKRKPKKKEETV